MSKSKGRSIMALQMDVVDFQYVAPFQIQDPSKVTRVKNRGQISTF